ncbi:MAG: hypothetical protein QME81_07980 [bacterium]|nr:hypothetical protein [bacterium]
MQSLLCRNVEQARPLHKAETMTVALVAIPQSAIRNPKSLGLLVKEEI